MSYSNTDSQSTCRCYALFEYINRRLSHIWPSPTVRYMAPAAVIKFHIVSPKMALNEQVCAHPSHIGSKFSKIFLAVVYRRACSCAPILRFSL